MAAVGMVVIINGLPNSGKKRDNKYLSANQQTAHVYFRNGGAL